MARAWSSIAWGTARAEPGWLERPDQLSSDQIRSDQIRSHVSGVPRETSWRKVRPRVISISSVARPPEGRIERTFSRVTGSPDLTSATTYSDRRSRSTACSDSDGPTLGGLIEESREAE